MTNLPNQLFNDLVNDLQLHHQWLQSQGQRGQQLYWEDMDLSGMNLSGMNLAEANLVSINFTDADLSHADLFAANLSSSIFHRANLNGANLAKATLDYAQLNEASIQEASLVKASLYEANLSHADLTHSDLRDAQMIQTNLDHTILRQCNLERISFRHVRMNQVIFRGVIGSEQIFAQDVEIVENGAAQSLSGEAFRTWLQKQTQDLSDPKEKQPYSWQDLKNELTRVVSQNRPVDVKINVLYPVNGSPQPAGLDVLYTIDGQSFTRTFREIPEGYDATRKA